jgi:hypothetical protein
VCDEFDERFLHELSKRGIGREHVNGAVEREHRRQLCDLKYLTDHSFSSEAGQALVPDLGEQLQASKRVSDYSQMNIANEPPVVHWDGRQTVMKTLN